MQALQTQKMRKTIFACNNSTKNRKDNDAMKPLTTHLKTVLPNDNWLKQKRAHTMEAVQQK